MRVVVINDVLEAGIAGSVRARHLGQPNMCAIGKLDIIPGHQQARVVPLNLLPPALISVELAAHRYEHLGLRHRVLHVLTYARQYVAGMIGFDTGFERGVNPCPWCDSVRRGGLSRYDDRRRGLPRVDEARRLKHLTVDFDSYVGSEGLPVAF